MIKKKYILRNIINKRESKKYIQRIIYLIKNVNLFII